MMWGYGYDPGWGMWLMMVLSNILWVALLGLLVWAVIRWFEQRSGVPGSQKPGTPAREPSALEILSQRYARGEIGATGTKASVCCIKQAMPEKRYFATAYPASSSAASIVSSESWVLS